jgi:hypothetical protein
MNIGIVYMWNQTDAQVTSSGECIWGELRVLMNMLEPLLEEFKNFRHLFFCY